MLLFDSRGNRVQLSDQLARGGEGSVHKVAGRSDVVAKIYHRSPSSERTRKLQAMVSIHTNGLAKLACWPTDILRQQQNGPISGFIMPNATGYKEAFKLYNPKARQLEFQNVHWGFLIRSAANMARAFAAVHNAGHVIGDVNHSSVMIAPDATVKLIDCDSFQVRFNGEQFPCEVGEPLHTAPELQGKSFKGVARTGNQDNFGLAVLIFELLFMGRHPFAGKFSGGDLALEEKIRTYRFAFGPHANARQMTQPPGTLALEAASTTIAHMFERAFSPEGARDGGRPSALEWVTALVGLENDLKRCSKDSGHYFWTLLRACPWCEIEAQTGVSNFNVAFAPVAGQGNFNLALVWDSIGKVRCPDDYLIPAASALPSVQASQLCCMVGKKRRVIQGVGIILSSGLGLASLFYMPLACIGLIIACAVLSSMLGAANAIAKDAKREVEQRIHIARSRYQSISAQWETHASANRFRNRLRELENRKAQYQDLPAYRQREYQKLQATIRDRQLHRFLDGYRIKPGQISGVGAGRCATLSAYGIDTANDVLHNRILNVPGFGEQLSWNMVYWRRQIEARFVFNPSLGIDKRDVQKLDNEIANLRANLELELRKAPNELRQLVTVIESARTSLRPQIDQVIMELARAEADLKAL